MANPKIRLNFETVVLFQDVEQSLDSIGKPTGSSPTAKRSLSKTAVRLK